MRNFENMDTRDFPTELDQEWFSQTNNLSTSVDVHEYFYKKGMESGLAGSPMCQLENFVDYIQTKFAGLDILQVCPESFVLRGENIKYAHWRPQFSAALAKQGLKPHYVLPELDFSSLRDRFECVFSFHQIQYAVDLIGFINDISACLKPGGIFACVVPDKNFTFEYGRQPSNLEEVLASHFDCRDRCKPGLLSWLLTQGRMRHNDVARHWQGDHGLDPVVDYHALLAAYPADGKYYDGRNWIFTPQFFRQLFNRLYEDGFIKLKLIRCYNTPFGSNAFHAIFKRDDRKYNPGSGKCQIRMPEELHDVVVGRDGMLFLVRGSNSLLEQYCQPVETVLAKARGISAIFKKRAEKLGAAGIQFLQLLLPEKNSVHCAMLGPDFPSSTPLYEAVTRELANFSWFMDGKSIVAEHGGFQKQDTHLTTKAAFALARGMLAKLGMPLDLGLAGLGTQFRNGDLLYMLVKDNAYKAPTEIASDLMYEGRPLRSKLVYKHDPDQGHMGKIRKFVNPDAPIDKKVICFGNSFFQDGIDSFNLTWHFARMFRCFEFYWQAHVDYEIVKSGKPDIVICQAIERYMGAIPERCAAEMEGGEK